jgi:hypothetical protein
MHVQIILTFGNGKEAEEHNTIAMRSSDVVMYVANRKIYGPVFIVSRSYRYSSFVAAENNGAKDGAVSFGILSNDILHDKKYQTHQLWWQTLTACVQAQFPDMKS